MRILVAIALALAVACAQAADKPPRSIAVLPFDYQDDSLQGDLEGPQPDDQKRAALVSRLVRKKLDAMPQFDVVSNEPAAGLIAKHKDRYLYLHRCNGCEIEIARKLGAELVFIGWSQKISNLILNVNGLIRETETRRDLAAGSVDMRSNTNEAWTRAALRLVDGVLPRSYAATLDNYAEQEEQ